MVSVKEEAMMMNDWCEWSKDGLEVTPRIEDVITVTTEKDEGKEDVTTDQHESSKKWQRI